MTPTASERVLVDVLATAWWVMVIGSVSAASRLPWWPWPTLWLSVALGAMTTWLATRTGASVSHPGSRGEFVMAILVTAGVGGIVAALAWPTLYPVASGPDLVHHLSLAHFIERYHALPVDAAFGPYLGEMTGYPPGSHVMAAMAAHWLGVDSLRVVHGLMACAVAIKAGFLFRIITRSLPQGPASVPLAAAGAWLVLVPHAYLLQSVVVYGFYSQVFAETFAIAMWWAVVAWHDRADTRLLALAAACGVGIVLTWPVFLPVPALAAFVVVSTRTTLTRRARLGSLVVALGPATATALAFAGARAGSAGILSSGGDVLSPTVALFGWPLAVLIVVGSVVVSRAWLTHLPVIAFTMASLGQVLALVVLQHLLGATNYYLGFKTVHLLVYPLVVLAAMGLAALWHLTVRGAARWRVMPATTAWIVPAIVIVALVRSDLPMRPLPSAFTAPVHRAGEWAREHVPANCVDYLVEHWLTAYWLHVDVLGNPRAATRDHDPYDFHHAMGRWVGTNSMRYAVVGRWDDISRDAHDHMRVLVRFDAAAVVERSDDRGTCSDETPPLDELVRRDRRATPRVGE